MPRNILLAFFCALPLFAQEVNFLPNPGFENQLADWQINDSISQLLPEAAHSGKVGLRIGSENGKCAGSSVQSSRLPVAPRQTFTLSFFARAKAVNAAAYIWYENAEGKLFQPQPPSCAIQAGDGTTWIRHSKEFTVPEEAVNFRLWIHSWSGATAPSEWDDFAITGLPPGTKAFPPPPPRAKKTEPDISPADIPRVANPPVIVLKFDDVKQVNNNVFRSWTRVAEYLEKRNIPAGFGVICNSFESGASDACKQWFDTRRRNGLISFWCHGLDHASHGEGKAARNEFVGRSSDELLERLNRCQAIAEREFGFTFHTFGPAGGIYGPTIDAAALDALARQPDFHTVLYPQPADAASKKYDVPGSGLRVLDRVWAVNMEGAVGVPDYQRFLNGYAKNLSRKYLVLQSHPAAWNDARFAEFERIIDFLVERGTVFMTPEALSDMLRESEL